MEQVAYTDTEIVHTVGFQVPSKQHIFTLICVAEERMQAQSAAFYSSSCSSRCRCTYTHLYMLYKSTNCMYLDNIPSLRHVQYKKGLHTMTETDLPTLFQPRYRSNTPSLPSTKPLLSSRNLCQHKQRHSYKCF